MIQYFLYHLFVNMGGGEYKLIKFHSCTNAILFSHTIPNKWFKNRLSYSKLLVCSSRTMSSAFCHFHNYNHPQDLGGEICFFSCSQSMYHIDLKSQVSRINMSFFNNTEIIVSKEFCSHRELSPYERENIVINRIPCIYLAFLWVIWKY